MSHNSAFNDIDLSFLYEIADGSDEFIVESITMFLEQTPEMLQIVADAIDARDWDTAAKSAHKMKSNLGFFGMLISQALIQDVELMCKAGAPSPDDLVALFTEAKNLINSNMADLKQVKAEKAAGL
jgi:HPt (histidine-containing phosphotransfer) domain-containing protein